MSERITCLNIRQEPVSVDNADLSFRPSAYGIIVREGKILMAVMKSTGKYVLPGGGIELGEPMEEALKREIREECGVEAEVLAPAFFEERFFLYETGKAWQCYLLFFVCRALTFDLSDADNEDDESNPQWVDLATLQPGDIQVCGKEILAYVRALGMGA